MCVCVKSSCVPFSLFYYSISLLLFVKDDIWKNSRKEDMISVILDASGISWGAIVNLNFTAGALRNKFKEWCKGPLLYSSCIFPLAAL